MSYKAIGAGRARHRPGWQALIKRLSRDGLMPVAVVPSRNLHNALGAVHHGLHERLNGCTTHGFGRSSAPGAFVLLHRVGRYTKLGTRR